MSPGQQANHSVSKVHPANTQGGAKREGPCPLHVGSIENRKYGLIFYNHIIKEKGKEGNLYSAYRQYLDH